ncbi:hypothetical protein OG250_25825 [Streptomyces sp. NBC_00487]|uniref:hypothetical protein n=1 Tax=unclassified Streptomyces TaxID=2593676 RepID=UPI002E19A59F|nr:MULTISPECIES: hypothetical protein [unclassified Streptomyces]
MNPSGWACTARSTSGSTDRYTADEPSTSGFGSAQGDDTAYFLPAVTIRASGSSVPPPENRMSSAARGARPPSGRVTSVVSTSVHAPSLRTRSGDVAVSAVNVPSGWATTLLVDDVNSSTSTGFLDATARSEARASAVAAGNSSSSQKSLPRAPSSAVRPELPVSVSVSAARTGVACRPPASTSTAAAMVVAPRMARLRLCGRTLPPAFYFLVIRWSKGG